MRQVFADTYYWIALLNDRDQGHPAAKAIGRTLGRATFITTHEVINEVLTYFCDHGRHVRRTVAAFVRNILNDPDMLFATSIQSVILERPGLLRSPPGQGIQPDRLHFDEGDA